jgi:hypothetical protein
MNLNDLSPIALSPFAAIRPAQAASGSKAAADDAVDATSTLAGAAMVSGDVIALSAAASADAGGDGLASEGNSLEASSGSSGAPQSVETSDPFRAYRDKSGAISLTAIMEIDALPPKLRELGKALKEAQSMKREMDGMKDNLPAGQEKYDALNAEYQAKIADIQGLMDKLGLTDKMKKDGMSLDDLVKGGISALKHLATDSSSDVDQGDNTADGSKASPIARIFSLFGKSDKAGAAARQGLEEAVST